MENNIHKVDPSNSLSNWKQVTLELYFVSMTDMDGKRENIYWVREVARMLGGRVRF